MNYNEFISISKESMNDITFEVYSKEIEPCYNWLPEVNSKKEFINWWKKNKNLCRWISNILVQLEEESGEKLKLKKRIAELEEDQFRNNRLIATLMGEKEAVMEEKEMVEQDKDKLEEELKYVREVKNKVDDENDKLTIALEKKNEQIEEIRRLAFEEQEKLMNKISELELKIAFTPDVIVREIRNEFFDTYDEKKQDALKRGIITE